MEGIFICKRKDEKYLSYYFVKGEYWFHPVGRGEGRLVGGMPSAFVIGGPKCLIKW